MSEEGEGQREIITVTKISSNGRIVLSPEAREILGVAPGSKVIIIKTGEREITIKNAQDVL